MKRLTWESGPPQLESAEAVRAAETRRGPADGFPHFRIALWWLAAWVFLSLLTLPTLEQQGQVPMFFRAGLSLALILWAGPRHIPMVLGVWFLTLSAISQFPQTSPWLTLARTVGLVGPFALGCMALRQMHFDFRLRRQRDVVLFLVVGVFLPAIPSAAAINSMGFSVMERTLPTVVSILSVTPFLLTNVIPLLEEGLGSSHGDGRGAPRTLWKTRAPVFLGSAASIGALMWLAHTAEQAMGVSIYFLCFLPIAWVAVRYGMALTTGVIFTTALAVAILQMFAWQEEVLNNSRVATLFFSAAGLVLASIEEERRQQADLIRRLAGVSDKSGAAYFRAVAANLGEALEADCAVICELISPTRVRSLAVWKGGTAAQEIEYDLAGTPCEGAACGSGCSHRSHLQGHFPSDRLLAELGAEAYVGAPLRSSTGEFLGLMATIYRRPLDSTRWIEAGLGAFASRTGAELERLRNEEAIRYSEQRYRALVQNSQEAVWRVEFDPPVPVDLPEDQIIQRMLDHGVMADVNEFGARMRGFGTRSDWVGMPLAQVLQHEADPISSLRDGVRNQFRFTQGIYEVRRDSGASLFVRRSLFGVVENGHLVRIWGTGQDVTEMILAQQEIQRLNTSLEDQVARRTLELRAAVNELEAFSYSASHDLRAPLLGVLGSGRVLVEDYRAKLDGPGQEWLDRLMDDASYMDRLLDAMLGLSRVSRADILWREVDLGEIATTVAANLRNREPGRVVELIVGPGLNAPGDPDLLRTVMENLIGNAWKFTRASRAPRIEVGAETYQGKRTYFVRDNGAGFDPRYASRLFTAFQRLHGKEFEGTGIGLATVQRVIHRHGGEVWAEGRPEEGATFFFTLDPPSPEAAYG